MPLTSKTTHYSRIKSSDTISRYQFGFSFIEILIVLAIVAGIATLVLRQSDTAIDSKLTNDILSYVRDMQAAQRSYVATHGRSGSLEDLIDDGLLNDEWADSYLDPFARLVRINTTIGTLPHESGRPAILVVLESNAEGLQTANQLAQALGGASNNCHINSFETAGPLVCDSRGGAWSDADLNQNVEGGVLLAIYID